MKKSSLILALLLFSFFAYSQKGISYQAVILDQNKIEIPGQDITGQPLVNSEVWVKFNISLGTIVQFEEIQKTKTDNYGLVNLIIGSEANTLFNTLIWDANQKSLLVYVSLNKGNTFTKVSDQKLLYVPYALNAESASKFTGIVPVSSGGTGATNAPDARTNLGLVIGKDVQAPLTAGVDYLTPSGNAASATTANNITATTNTSLTSLSNLNTVGTITKGVWNGSTIAIANGGTGATTAIEALNNLGAAAIESPSFKGTPTAPNPATGDNSTQIATTAFVTGAIQGANQGLASNYVPYIGATKPVDLGGFDLTVNGVNAGMGKGNISTNTVFGNGALTDNTTGTSNTAYGALTLGNNTTGIDNTAIGALSLYPNTTGSQNTAIGSRSLRNNTTGTNNTANGALALTLNTTGSQNTATGSRSLRNNTTGINNTANGYAALRDNTSGGGNTATGSLALLSNNTGSNNTALGSEADVTTNNLNNATAIGYQAKVSSSNNIQLGNSSVTNVQTSGALTTGTVTYPTIHGTSGQVLSTTGSGTLTWTTPAATISNISVGLNLDLGGYVIYVTPNGKHGLVVPLQDQADINHMVNGNISQSNVSDPNNYDSNGKNFTDWRVPTKYELGLMSLKRNEIGGFSILDSSWLGMYGYWSSTADSNSYDDDSNFYLVFVASISGTTFTALQRRIFIGMVRAIRSF